MDTSTERSGPGREQRFRALYDAAYVDLLRFVQRRTHPAHAEDVVADVLLVAWRRLDDVPAATGDARAWLFGVARGTLANGRRGELRHAALAVRVAGALSVLEPHHGDDAELVARRVDLAAVWPRLSPTDQESLALTVWDDLTAVQAAAVLDISAVAYRLRLSRARRTLRRLLQDAGPAPARPRRPTPEDTTRERNPS